MPSILRSSVLPLPFAPIELAYVASLTVMPSMPTRRSVSLVLPRESALENSVPENSGCSARKADVEAVMIANPPAATVFDSCGCAYSM